MSTQGEQPDGRGTEEFRDSGLDQDHLAEAFEEMEAAPEGGALLEGETAEESDGSADADGPSDDHPNDAHGGDAADR